MEEVFVAIFVPLGFFGAIAFITKVISDNRTRRRILEARPSEGLARALLSGRRPDPSAMSALKWGLVAGAIGLSLVLIDALAMDEENPVTYGIILLAAGGGLVGYYWLVRDQEPDDTITDADLDAALRKDPNRKQARSEESVESSV
jgi:hypothetical protein